MEIERTSKVKTVRRKIVFVLVFVLVVSTAFVPFVFMYGETFGYPWNYWRWQRVEVSDVCSFKVPGQWSVSQLDNTIYLTDQSMNEEGYTIFFAGIYERVVDAHTSPEALLDLTAEGEYLQSEFFSNSANIVLKRYYVNGEAIERYSITFYPDSGGRLTLIGWHKSIDGAFAKRIALSMNGI